jgi:RecB family exonuclease
VGDSGVHVIDAESARFGDFERVQLAGLVDGEWPAAARRSILYGSDILRQLGWPSEVDRREAARARFFELLRSASHQVRVSAFSLEGDSLVSPSPFLEELAACELELTEHPDAPLAVFEHEGLTLPVPRLDHLGASARAWAAHRLARDGGARTAGGHLGTTDTLQAPAYSLSALERYQDCPFRFFAAHVLRLEEEPEDQSVLTPRRRGQLLHDILHRFFARWDDAGEGAITPDTLDRAREMFTAVAEPLLSALPESEAALERARVCGTAISLGVMDIVLGLEATRKEAARERWLEYRLEGRFSLGATGGPAVPLRGVADRIDLLPGRRLRVIDYKTGFAPAVDRALQVPVYALCAQQRLSERDGAPWRVAEAMYLSFAGRRAEVPVVSADADAGASAAALPAALPAARERLLQVLSGIEAGTCTPAPYDPAICRTCAYSAVCRIGVTADD